MAFPARTPIEQPPHSGVLFAAKKKKKKSSSRLEEHTCHVHTAIIEYVRKAGLEQFYDFWRNDENFFNALRWMYADDPLLFWNIQSSDAPEVAELAIRLHQGKFSGIGAEFF